MENNPELHQKGKYLGVITTDFSVVADTLREASYEIRKRGFSDYPIFPICKETPAVGQLLIPKEELNLNWNYNASYLDEFLQRKLIDEESLAHFKSIYKDPEEYCCLFIIDIDFTNFVFLPYPEEG